MAQGGDVSAGAEWDSPAARIPLCPALPEVGQGQLQHDNVGILPVDAVTGHPIAKMHQKELDPGAMESPQGMSWERNG